VVSNNKKTLAENHLSGFTDMYNIDYTNYKEGFGSEYWFNGVVEILKEQNRVPHFDGKLSRYNSKLLEYSKKAGWTGNSWS
jgi:hypothetical protein